MPNAIDLPAGSDLWTQQENNLYNKLPLYMTKLQVEVMQFFSRHKKLIKPVPWKANQGTTMQGVRKVKSPIRRQQALPTPITTAATRDVEEVRETQEKVQVYHKKFESNLMHFVPNFFDFLTDHVDAAVENLTEKIEVYEEQFYRTAIFHGSPYVWVAGKAPGTELTATAGWTAPTITLAKTQANIQALLSQVQKTLDIRELIRIQSVMYEDLRIPLYTGSVMQDGTSGSPMKGRYAFVSGSGVWDKFHDDPYLLDNKNHNLDIVTDQFRGDIAGRVRGLNEYLELRFAVDGSAPQPETTEENPDAYNFGETVPSSTYNGATFATAFMYGAEGWKNLRVGPAPKDFAKGEMSMKQFRALNINGEVKITKDVLVPMFDENNVATFDTNKYGEFLQLISYVALGILPIQRRNVIPVLYRRGRVEP